MRKGCLFFAAVAALLLVCASAFFGGAMGVMVRDIPPGMLLHFLGELRR